MRKASAAETRAPRWAAGPAWASCRISSGPAEFTSVPAGDYWPFDVTGQYAFPLGQSKLQPYLLAGFGVSRWSQSGLGLEPEFKAYTNDGTLFRVGVGLYYRFGS